MYAVVGKDLAKEGNWRLSISFAGLRIEAGIVSPRTGVVKLCKAHVI